MFQQSGLCNYTVYFVKGIDHSEKLIFFHFSQQLHKMIVQQLKRKSSGSLNTGVQTKRIERSGDNLKRFNIHMEMKTAKNLLYLHPLNLPKRGQNFTGVGL